MGVITGKIRSATVTVALHVELFPAASRTVSTTVFAPRLVQLKLDLLIEVTKLPCAVQLSHEPSLTSATVRVAAPDAFKFIVAALQVAVGGSLSVTVTVKLQGLLLLLLASLTE